MEADFSGYATKAGLKCSDGRTITAEAFKHQDKMTVPLVWQHGHQSADNVLGHMELEARDETHPDGAGIYGYGYFNDTPQGINGKKLVEHKDIDRLSIYANNLVEKTISGAKQVLHGAIREVSLVLSGANPGAQIDYGRIAHSDGDIEVLEDEAIILTGLPIEHSQKPVGQVVLDPNVAKAPIGDLVHADTTDPTVQEVYDSLTQVQKDVVNYMIGAALEDASGSVAQSDLGPDAAPQEVYDAMTDSQKAIVHSMIEDAKSSAVAEHSALTDKEGTTVTNVFETQSQSAATLQHAAMMEARSKLTPERIRTIMADAERGGSLKESFISHADEYGITNIDLLFPDARLDQNGITYLSRRMEWVNNVLTNTKHSPFSRIKSMSADITAEEARAKGYVKGNLKKDEVIKMLRRITTPKTIYKKQKLDRDDILDITDLDIVAWLKAEMRLMLDEELARAILIGDGRAADDEDKIDEDHIRPIAFDIDMYTTTVRVVEATDTASTNALIDALVTALNNYKGTGQPTLYTTQSLLTKFLLVKDTLGRRIYPTKNDLAAALLVADVVPVEAMEQENDLIAVLVNLQDYTVGADAGGQVSMFDDFDIDYNQQKYLIETRVSGALTRPKSAVAIVVDSGHTVTPTAPTFVTSTGVLTVPTQTGTVYQNEDTGATLTAGAQTAIAAGATIDVIAVPAAGYGFTHDSNRDWSFTRDA